MLITLKNKDTLICDDFKFKCCVGKKGLTSQKKEGDKKTPKGTYTIGPLYYRADRSKQPSTKLKVLKIADEYFDGKYDSFNAAVALTEGFVDEQIQICEQIYKK